MRAQAEHDARMALRAAKTAATGKKPGGPVSQVPCSSRWSRDRRLAIRSP